MEVVWEAKSFAKTAGLSGPRFSLAELGELGTLGKVIVYDRLESVALILVHKHSST